MTDLEKLEALYEQIDELISSNVTSDSQEFITWETKLKRLLKKLYGANSDEVTRFEKICFSLMVYTPYDSHGDFAKACKNGLNEAKAVLMAFLEDEEGITTEKEKNNEFNKNSRACNEVFIVHGHDGELKEAVARLIEKQNLKPIILNEQANQGYTIIEKFEKNSNVGAAILLFTADDLGKDCNAVEEHYRARQNVVFEAGYFMAKLGRDHTIMLATPGVEIPSDLQGVVYTDTDIWKFGVLKELHAMGYSIDFNKML